MTSIKLYKRRSPILLCITCVVNCESLQNVTSPTAAQEIAADDAIKQGSYPIIHVTTSLRKRCTRPSVYTTQCSIHYLCVVLSDQSNSATSKHRQTEHQKQIPGFASVIPLLINLGHHSSRQRGPLAGWLGLSLTVRRTGNRNESRAALYNSDSNQIPQIIPKKVHMCISLIMSVTLSLLLIAAAKHAGGGKNK